MLQTTLTASEYCLTEIDALKAKLTELDEKIGYALTALRFDLQKDCADRVTLAYIDALTEAQEGINSLAWTDFRWYVRNAEELQKNMPAGQIK